MSLDNAALWLPKPGRPFEVGPAPITRPGPGEVLVRVRAVAVNPVDDLPVLGYRLVLPWLRFPAIVGGEGTSQEVLDNLAADWKATFAKYGRGM